MRHIPEDELHAYLDQGLSRSQCVEIESHLAGCASCQATRDGIAALRDRTTALVARLVPSRSFPVAFETLHSRAAIEASARRRRLHLAGWAASIVAAVAVGWTASYLTSSGASVHLAVAPSPGSFPVARPAAVTESVKPADSTAGLRPLRSYSARARISHVPARILNQVAVKPEASPPVLPPAIAASQLELTSVDIPRAGSELELDGMWRTMSWAGAQAEAGDKLPHIDGLPVVQVQVQANQQGSQPLMVVAQQLASGEVIQTIEGPATDVSHLLAGRKMTDPNPTVPSSDSGRTGQAGTDHIDRAMAMQRGDRMLAITGALPSDSLLAMIRRLNAEMRSK